MYTFIHNIYVIKLMNTEPTSKVSQTGKGLRNDVLNQTWEQFSEQANNRHIVIKDDKPKDDRTGKYTILTCIL